MKGRDIPPGYAELSPGTPFLGDDLVDWLTGWERRDSAFSSSVGELYNLEKQHCLTIRKSSAWRLFTQPPSPADFPIEARGINQASGVWLFYVNPLDLPLSHDFKWWRKLEQPPLPVLEEEDEWAEWLGSRMSPSAIFSRPTVVGHIKQAINAEREALKKLLKNAAAVKFEARLNKTEAP